MKEYPRIDFARNALSRDLPRWGMAAAIALMAHGAVAAGVAAFAPVRDVPALVPSLKVDLAPLVTVDGEPVAEVTTIEAEKPEEIAEIDELPPEVEEVREEVVEADIEKVVDEQPEEVTEVEEEVFEQKPAPVVTKAAVVLPKKKIVRKAEKPVDKPKQKPVKKVESKTPPVTGGKASSHRTETAQKSAPRGTASEMNRWKARVQATVARRKPRSLGIGGRVSVHFVVSLSGSVISSRVTQSSGNAALDQAALSMVRGRLPAPPAGTGQSSFDVTLPVVFQ